MSFVSPLYVFLCLRFNWPQLSCSSQMCRDHSNVVCITFCHALISAGPGLGWYSQWLAVALKDVHSLSTLHADGNILPPFPYAMSDRVVTWRYCLHWLALIRSFFVIWCPMAAMKSSIIIVFCSRQVLSSGCSPSTVMLLSLMKFRVFLAHESVIKCATSSYFHPYRNPCCPILRTWFWYSMQSKLVVGDNPPVSLRRTFTCSIFLVQNTEPVSWVHCVLNWAMYHHYDWHVPVIPHGC